MRKRIKRSEYRTSLNDVGVLSSQLKETKRKKTDEVSKKIAKAFSELN